MKTIISRLNDSDLSWDVMSFSVFFVTLLIGLNILTAAGVPFIVRAFICVPIGVMFGYLEQSYRPKEKEKPAKPARIKNRTRFVIGASISIAAVILLGDGGPTFHWNFGVFLFLIAAMVGGCIVAVWGNYDRA